jgi:hypothetical protein
MRMCRIPELDYPAFEAMRDAMYDEIPFAIIESVYSKKLRTGFFNFWDSDYIPENLQEYIVQPPANKEKKEAFELRIFHVVSAWKQGEKFAQID